MAKAIVLLSGGLDSAVTLGIALDTGLDCYPLAFDYSQRHRKEVQSAYDIVAHYKTTGYAIEALRVVSLIGLDLPTSALTSDVQVPMDEAGKEGIPVTYVPARNAIFLSVGVGFAEALGADSVWAGYNAVDSSGYPDCRPEFVDAMEAALTLGTKRGVEGTPVSIWSPIINSSKEVIVRRGLELEVPLQHTWSCYVGQDEPCGHCDSCIIRAAAFTKLGVADPALG